MKNSSGNPGDRSILDYMLALEESATISEAAARCGIGQSALSNALKRLESQLETRLYDRKAGVLTPAGEIYAKYAKEILQVCGECRAALDAMTEGSFALGLSSCLGDTVAVRVKDLIGRAGPRLRFSMISAEYETLAQRVAAGTLDMYCAFDSGNTVPGFITRSAEPVPLCLAVPGWAGSRDLQAILSSHVLLLLRDPAMTECMRQFLRRGELQPLRISETNSYDMARLLMEQGGAVCAAPAVLEPEFPGVSFIPLPGCALTPVFVYRAYSPAAQIREEIILAITEICGCGRGRREPV